MTYTAIDPKFTQSLFMKNPFMSQWLSIANTMAGTARGFWAAEFSRQQSAAIAAMSRETMRFWSSAWTMFPTEAARMPERAAAAMETAGAAAQLAGRAMPASVELPTLKVTPRAKPVAAKRTTRQSASAKRKSGRR
ncbi:hypothetical protein [Elioraea rosea]|uniref:hypothetical protein n=1 Tax=Elioraea rosea TaxID=2492390 RepID=UPI0013159326|nr:hypothetical protein [Elioraea rosea]